MKRLLIAALVLGTTGAWALDLGKLKDKTKAAGQTDVGQAVSSKASAEADKKVEEEFTRKLKDVQNKKGPILFKLGKAEVDPACDPTMQEIADIIASVKGYKVRVDGHTDNKGKKSANQKLSEQRAAAVVTYLVKIKSVDKTRLASRGFGDSQPIADNKTEEGRTKNRRVDFTVTKMP
jgi:outer membrane protein OmpA-like peptidoglycan-associated protein